MHQYLITGVYTAEYYHAYVHDVSESEQRKHVTDVPLSLSSNSTTILCIYMYLVHTQHFKVPILNP